MTFLTNICDYCGLGGAVDGLCWRCECVECGLDVADDHDGLCDFCFEEEEAAYRAYMRSLMARTWSRADLVH